MSINQHHIEVSTSTSREEYLEAVIDLQPEMVCRFMPDTTLTFVNQAYCRAFNIPKEQLIGKKFLDFVPEADHESILASLSTLSAENPVQKYAHEVLIPSGEIVLQEWTDIVILDENNQVTEIQSTGRDVTDQVKAERERDLLTSLQQLIMKISGTYINIPLTDFDKTVQNSLGILGEFCEADRVYIFDYNYEKECVSNTFEWCDVGIESHLENLQEIPFSELSHWVDLHNRGEVLTIPNIEDLPDDDPVRDILKSQEIQSLLVVPIMDVNRCVGFVGLDYVSKQHTFGNYEEKLLRLFAQLLLNVRNRVKTENALHDRERFLADIINNSASVIMVKSIDGMYQLVNEKWSQVFGYSQNEVIGKSDDELFPIHIAKQLQKEHQLVLSKGDTHEHEIITEKNNIVQYYLCTSFPVKETLGRITGVCSVGIDMTDRKQAYEEKLTRTRAEAESQAKSIFLKNISRDIRLPLNTIIGVTQSIKLPDTTLLHDQIQTIRRSSRQLMSLINNVIDYSKLESDTLKLLISDFSLHEVLSDIVAMFEERARMKGLTLHLLINDSVPDMIRSDETRLRQILVNVVGNAIRYTEKGQIELTISSKRNLQRKLNPQTRDDYAIIFEVSDTGRGIAAHELNSIFTAYRKNRTILEEQGTGLGLAITNALLVKLGGTINVSSQPGEGSCFTITIPVNKAYNQPS